LASLAKDFEAFEAVVIEDNPCDAELTLRALERGGLAGKVKVFPDGVEALDYLFIAPDAPYEFPKVILLDLKLPRMSGLEILGRLKGHERTRLIPVVMLTSSQEESDILESYRLGVNSYLVKPVDYDEYFQVVEDLALYWLRRNKVSL
jgi:CheY-like chemotaxis protein